MDTFLAFMEWADDIGNRPAAWSFFPVQSNYKITGSLASVMNIFMEYNLLNTFQIYYLLIT